MRQPAPAETPTIAHNVGTAANKRLSPARHEPLTVAEAVDTTAVVVGAASLASAAAAVVWWRVKRSR